MLDASWLVAAVGGLVIFAVMRLGFKGLALRLLRLYKAASLVWLRLRGLTPTDVVERRVVTGMSQCVQPITRRFCLLRYLPSTSNPLIA